MPSDPKPVRLGGSAAGGDGDMFTAVSLSRVSQAIVEQVKVLLRQGRLRPGDRLPSERELCERFGVSRVTVREGLRVLEAGGLIEIRVGAHGGAFITSPTSQRVGAGLADLLSLSPLTPSDVAEARQVFELGIVPLVVERATDDDIAALRATVGAHRAALGSGKYTAAMSAQLPVQIAACTHNPAIEMLVQSFHGTLLMSLLGEHSVAASTGRRGSQEHEDFVDAVAHRDAERALEVMRAHLQRATDRVDRAGRAGRVEGDGDAPG